MKMCNLNGKHAVHAGVVTRKAHFTLYLVDDGQVID